MDFSALSGDQTPTFGRTVTIALVGVLLVSTITGAIAAPPVAAQQQNGSAQAGGGDSVTKQEFRNWINEVMGMDKGAAQEAARKNPEYVAVLARAFKQSTDTQLSGTRLTDTIKQRPQYVINNINQASGGGSFPAPVAAANSGGAGGGNGGPNATSNASNGTVANGTTGKAPTGNTTGNASAGGPTPNQSVNQIISEFKAKNLGYQQLSQENKSKANDILVTVTQNNLSQQQVNTKLDNLEQLFANASGAGNLANSKRKEQRRQVVMEHVGEREKRDPLPDIDIDIPGMLDQKLEAIADALREGASAVVEKVYPLAFSTPVPQNDGWASILGTPTNEPFQSLHQQLLTEKLYPLTNMLLGMGVIVMGLSLTVTPLISRFRVLDLTTKFVSFLFLYTFSWVAVTLIHGIVDDITVWLRPSQQAMTALATDVGKLSAGAVGAYLAGSGGILATVFGLGLELGLRRVALQYVFPYVFPALVLLLYVSPWQRLKSLASVVLWQYVNVLIMVIPMAILLKAAAIVNFSTGDGIVAMLVLVALFLTTVVIPLVSTYTFLQIPGKAARAGKSAAVGAASRASNAKDRIGWGGDESGSDGTATADTSPGSRTEQAVEVSTDGGTTGIPSDGELSDDQIESMDPDGGSATTAGQVRDLEHAENQDPMNPSAMKESYFDDQPDEAPETLANQ